MQKQNRQHLKKHIEPYNLIKLVNTQFLIVGYFFIFLNLPQQFQSNFNSQTASERFFFNILSIGVHNVLTTNN